MQRVGIGWLSACRDPMAATWVAGIFNEVVSVEVVPTHGTLFPSH